MRGFIFSIFIWTTLLVMGSLPAFSIENEMKMVMKKSLPLEVGSYKHDGKDQFFDRNTTFHYMDGAAELYRSYGFKLLMVRRYTKMNHPPIMVELFDMGSSEDAFGIFSYETGGEEVGIGQGSDYGGGLLRFWKGKFFSNVYGEQETPLTKQDVLEIGTAIANSIKNEGTKPKLLQFLPKEGLIERHIRYFHHPHILNHHYFISHQNILHLKERTQAILGSYPSSPSKEKTFLLLIQYASQKLAEDALRSFKKAYMPGASTSSHLRTESGRWTYAQSHQRYVIVVFDAPSQEKAEELIQTAQKNLERRRP